MSAAIRPHGDYPLINGSITARGRTQTGVGSWIGDFGSVIPGSAETRFEVEVDVLLAWDPGVRPFGEYWEMVVQYWGVLGQRVVEHYEFLPQRWLDGEVAIVTRLYRLEVIPSVAGADPVDYPFGEPFRDPLVVPPVAGGLAVTT